MSGQKDVFYKKALSTILFPCTITNLLINKQNKVKEPGTIVKVKNRDFHCIVSGENKGNPTVILDAGLSGNCLAWCLVQPQLAKMTKVVSFDRKGYGWSDIEDSEITSLSALEDLKLALQELNIAPPYILVGHSFAGLHIRLFASKYPEDVVGLVFVDAVHQDRYIKERMDSDRLRQYEKSLKMMRVANLTSLIGLPRLLKMPVGGRSLPKRVQNYVKYVGYTPSAYEVSYKEMLYSEKSARQVEATQKLKEDLPIVVVSSNNKDEAWKEQQQKLCQLTNKSVHIQTENNHSIQLENPAVVVEAVEKIIGNITE